MTSLLFFKVDFRSLMGLFLTWYPLEAESTVAFFNVVSPTGRIHGKFINIFPNSVSGLVTVNNKKSTDPI